MYEDIMTPGTAVTAPSGHQPPPTTWLRQHHQLERTQESIKWSGVFLAQGEQVRGRAGAEGHKSWEHFSWTLERGGSKLVLDHRYCHH